MSDIEDDLAAALAEVTAKHERSMVTRWVVVVETIDAEGERGVWMVADLQAKAWDTVGLLGHALNVQRAQTVKAALEDTD